MRTEAVREAVEVMAVAVMVVQSGSIRNFSITREQLPSPRGLCRGAENFRRTSGELQEEKHVFRFVRYPRPSKSFVKPHSEILHEKQYLW